MTGAAVAERHLTLVHDETKRAKALRRFNRDDQIFRAVTLTSALTVLVLLAGVMVALLHGSLPAWRAFGLGFFTSESWNPVTEKFGALPAIYGTLLTSFIAMRPPRPRARRTRAGRSPRQTQTMHLADDRVARHAAQAARNLTRT